MKIIWEEDDIKPGTIYFKPGSSEAWIIGYLGEFLDPRPRYVSCSMSDGLLTPVQTRDYMAETLTLEGYIPAKMAPSMGIALPRCVEALIKAQLAA